MDKERENLLNIFAPSSLSIEEAIELTDRLLDDGYRKQGEARAEAVREFAELFKERLRDVSRLEIGGHTYYTIGESFIDKIVKEMVGDTECQN